MNPVLTFSDVDQLSWLFHARPRVIVHVAAILWANSFPDGLRKLAAARGVAVDFAVAVPNTLSPILGRPVTYGETVFVSRGVEVAAHRPAAPATDWAEILGTLLDPKFGQQQQQKRERQQLADWSQCLDALPEDPPANDAAANDAWAIAGVRRGATRREIARARKAFLRDFHSDRIEHLGLPESVRKVLSEEFHRRRDAFERLLDEAA